MGKDREEIAVGYGGCLDAVVKTLTAGQFRVESVSVLEREHDRLGVLPSDSKVEVHLVHKSQMRRLER